MRIAFINPPFLPDYSRGQRSPAVTRSGTLYYPMWLAYSSAYAQNLGNEVFLIDAPAEKLETDATRQRTVQFRPDIALVETATPSVANDLEFAGSLKRLLPSCRVFACGTHVSALPEEALLQAPQLDGIIIGEYEIPLHEIVQALGDGRSLSGLEGVYTPGGKAAPRTRFLADLETMPFVSAIYKGFLPIPRYFNPNAHHPMVSILSGRGCPSGCTFCVFPQTLTGRGYRKRSVDSLLAEFQWIVSNLPEVRGVFLEDDTFTADIARVREFSERLTRLDLPLTWTANSRANVDLETLKIMKRSKVRALCVGFESGNQELLDNIQKGLTLDQSERFAHDAQTAGVKVHGCFMVGLPGETRVTLQQTLQFACRLPLDSAQFYPLMVYPGTKAFEWAKTNRMLIAKEYRDWLSPEGLHQCVVRTRDLSAGQLVKFCNHARRRFYLRKSYLWNLGKRIIKDEEERHRVIRSAQTFLQHLIWDR